MTSREQTNRRLKQEARAFEESIAALLSAAEAAMGTGTQGKLPHGQLRPVGVQGQHEWQSSIGLVQGGPDFHCRAGGSKRALTATVVARVKGLGVESGRSC